MTARRVEVYAAVPDARGAALLVPAGPRAELRVPGVVLAHGERPRAAARRALAEAAAAPAPAPAAAADPSVTEELRLLQVLSDVRTAPGGPETHVLRLLYAARTPAPDPDLLHDALASPVAARSPDAPPAVQRPAAYAVVVRGGEALLTRVTGLGVWTLPGGGLDHGEHPDDAVVRETFEETGLELVSAHLLDADSRHFTGRGPDQVLEDFHAVRVLYRGVVSEGREPQVQEVGGSTDAVAWVPLDRLVRLRLADIARTALHRER